MLLDQRQRLVILGCDSVRPMMYYLFDRIPGQHPAYTVAVLAVGPTDARAYMKALWSGGRLSRTVTAGLVKADCGAITDAAAERLAAQNSSEPNPRPKARRSRNPAAVAGTDEPA